LRSAKYYYVPLFICAVFFSRAGCQLPETEFSGESAFRYLVQQCEFGPRNPGSTGHSECLQFLVEELRKFTHIVSTQQFLHRDTDLDKILTMHNIIARFPGTNHRAQPVLLAAHWDTRPRADRDPNPENRNNPIIGANDGASGVAVLLETARIFSEFPPPIPVDILLTDGEDYGKEGEIHNYFLGAKHFAKNLPKIPYKLGILLDMIGDKDLRIPREAYSVETLPDFVDSVWKRARNLGLKAFTRRKGPYVLDDHQPLIEAGVPIIDIIDFDYDYWHTLEDTPDKCSAESLKQIGMLILSIVYEGL